MNLGGGEIILKTPKKMNAVQRQMRDSDRQVNDSMERARDGEDPLIAVRTRFSVGPRVSEGEQFA